MKPHIIKVEGDEWCCLSLGHTAYGRTPYLAYMVWRGMWNEINEI